MPPVKSAFSQFRKGVSFFFVEEQYRSLTESFIPHMRRYKGYHLIAFDGDQYDLPASKDILEHGYRGYPVDEVKETHYPKMYTVKAMDILSDVIIGFSESSRNDEIGQALSILPTLPKKNFSFYDRLYLSERLIKGHFESNQDFVARCKNGSTFKGVVDFNNQLTFSAFALAFSVFPLLNRSLCI